MKYNINKNWKFYKGQLEYDDININDTKDWQSIDIPHDYSVDSEYSKVNPSGRAGGFLECGHGWYYYNLGVIKHSTDDIVLLSFDGVYRHSTIYINSYKAFGRRNGYLGFDIDITDHISDNDNHLFVHVDNSQQPGDRWYSGSGIYRDVDIQILPQTHIDRNELYSYTKYSNDISTTIHADYTIASMMKSSEYSMEFNIHYNDVLCVKQNIAVKSSMGEINMTIDDVRLWDEYTPNLYKLTLILYRNESIIDEHSIDIGIRQIEFDADKGFIINGSRRKLKGVCLHQDASAFGSAVPREVWEIRLQQLKDMGCNAIRISHHPAASIVYDLCDRMGIYVMDEAFDGWHKKAEYDYGSIDFQSCYRQDLIDFVKRDRNHACVIMWSLGNETGDTDIYNMTDIVHSLDCTRPTTGGHMVNGVDVAGYNGHAEAPGFLEEFKRTHTDMPVVLTEVPHVGQTRGFYRTKTWWRDHGRPRMSTADVFYKEVFDDYDNSYSHVVRHNSSYDNAIVRITHRDAWRMTRNSEYISGQFIWTGYDYLGESFGWPYKTWNFGLIDSCGFEKDIFYFYRSEWSDKPTLHMLPHWSHEGKQGEIIPVWVYTNCQSVELILNGVSLGKKLRYDDTHMVWYVKYEQGCLEAVGEYDGQTITQKYHSTGDARSLNITIDAEKENLYYLRCTAVDINNNPVPAADNKVCYISDDLIGCDNGDPANLISPSGYEQRLFYSLGRVYTKKPQLTAVLLFGRRYFDENTVIGLSKAYIGDDVKTSLEIAYYGNEMQTDDIEYRPYDGEMTISDTTYVYAKITVNNNACYISDIFTKGKRQVNTQPETKISQKLVGEWMDESNDRYTFMDNGKVILHSGESADEFTWWYQESFDAFEADTNADAYNGEIELMWETAGLSLIDDNKLRVMTKDMEKILIRQ